MSTSYVHEFAKIGSVDDVYSIYDFALDKLAAEGAGPIVSAASDEAPKLSKAKRAMNKLRGSAERGAARVRESAAANAAIKKKSRHGIGHAIRHNKGLTGAALAVGGGGAYLAHRHFNREKNAGIASRLMRRPKDMSGTANLKPKSIYKNIRAGFHDAREGIARNPAHQAQRDEGKRGLQFTWAEEDMPADWGRALYKGVKKLKGKADTVKESSAEYEFLEAAAAEGIDLDDLTGYQVSELYEFWSNGY